MKFLISINTEKYLNIQKFLMDNLIFCAVLLKKILSNNREWSVNMGPYSQPTPSYSIRYIFKRIALHKKWSFSLRISSVIVTKSRENEEIAFTEEILNGKLQFLCSVRWLDFHFILNNLLLHTLNKFIHILPKGSTIWYFCWPRGVFLNCKC